jgi:hypothetical protein
VLSANYTEFLSFSAARSAPEGMFALLKRLFKDSLTAVSFAYFFAGVMSVTGKSQ